MKKFLTSLLAFVLVATPFMHPVSAYAANDITVEAENESGATVSFQLPELLDASSTPLTVSCDPASGSLFPVGTTTVSCEGTDSASTVQATDSFDIIVNAFATEPEETSTTTASTTPETGGGTDSGTASSTPSVNVLIRNGDSIVWNGAVEFAEDSGATSVSSTGGSENIAIENDSLLAVLLALDEDSDAFSVSDLDYYASFGSFLVNCISAPTWSSDACGSWQYMVNGTYPFTAIDQYELSAGDEVFLFFGSPRRVSVPAEVVVGQSFTASAEAYEPSSGTYGAATGYTIGITQPNPDNPWSPLEIATSSVNANGEAVFTLDVTGSYDIGIAEDYYYPATAFTAVAATTTASSTDTTGGSSGNETEGADSFDTSGAFSFLTASQDTDGSWSSPLVTDWAALALALSGAPSSAKSKLSAYLREDDTKFSLVTDNQRRALALMALNINPYTGAGRNYISPIVDEFDGSQIGETDLVNDDIFGLIALMHAGYSEDDEIIRKTAAFVVGAQRSDGSWVASADVTAAAIQALAPLSSLSGVSSAITKAKAYLKNVQRSDGGFGDAFATSWALGSIAALGESPSDWSKDGKSPLDALIAYQSEDGGMTTTPSDTATRSWATAYALPAAAGKRWDAILRDFKKPKGVENEAAPSASSDNDEEVEATTEQVVETEEVVPEAAELLEQPNEEPAATDTTDTAGDEQPAEVEEVAIEDAPETPDQLAAVGASGALEVIANVIKSFFNAIKNLFVSLF